MELLGLKKLWRPAKDNEYASPRFYLRVSDSAWVSYAFVPSRGGISGEEETAVTSSIRGDAPLHHLWRGVGLRCEGSCQSAPPDCYLMLVK